MSEALILWFESERENHNHSARIVRTTTINLPHCDEIAVFAKIYMGSDEISEPGEYENETSKVRECEQKSKRFYQNNANHTPVPALSIPVPFIASTSSPSKNQCR